MRVLGISAFYHDSAAALIRDGRVVAAAQEERFSRKKHDPAFPSRAINYCLEAASLRVGDLDRVVFYDHPVRKAQRLALTYLAHAPRGLASFRQAVMAWVGGRMFQRSTILRGMRALPGGERWNGHLSFAEHHLSHAASAFLPSPYRRAAILTIDGVGEWTTTAAGLGDGGSVNLHRELRFPHSLGLLYSAFTSYLGFKVNSGEFKVMGLAPFGEPKYERLIRDRLIDVKEDGSFWLDDAYLAYAHGLQMTTPRFHALFGRRPRARDEPLTRREADIAASIQAVVEEVVFRLARSLQRETGESRLCMAGGVALNCTANGKLVRSGVFDSVWVQPAAGDAGGALGAALYDYHHVCRHPRTPDGEQDAMHGACLGPAFPQRAVVQRLNRVGAVFRVLAEEALLKAVVESLLRGEMVGWMQGRMEFGPRALGMRSILADPRSPSARRTLNQCVKQREMFRPFAPSVPVEHASEWFDLDVESPYMAMTTSVSLSRRTDGAPHPTLEAPDRDASHTVIPAVSHVDYSARVQTVDRRTHPRFWALLNAFGDRTGCPVLVNTSFNVRGEPIVCSPEDAFSCFMRTGLDALVVEDCYLTKVEQPPGLQRDEAAFDPD